MSESSSPLTSENQHQVDPVDNDASFVVPQPAHSSTKSHGVDQYRVFEYRKWLLILAVSVVAIGATAAIIVAIQASQPKVNRINPSSRPTPAEVEITTTHDQGDDSFFAKLPLTLLYYSYSQTTNTKNVFQANPRDDESRFINVGFPDRYSFLTSPNGKSLIRWNETMVEIASAIKPANFQTLFKPEASQIMIRRAVWSTDSSRVAISYTKAAVDTKKYANVVAIVEVPTGNSTIVVESETDYIYDLMALVDNSRLFYRQDRNGLYSNLTEYNATEKKISRDLPQFNSNGLLSKLTFSSKMDWAYTFEDNQVIRYNVTTFAKEVVYAADRSCGENRPDNATSITNLSVSPNNDQILFTVVPKPCRNSPKDQDLRARLYSYKVNDKKVIKELVEPSFTTILSSSWAPDNSMVWLQIDTQTAYGINPTTLDSWSIPPVERNRLTKERPLLLGWLLPKT